MSVNTVDELENELEFSQEKMFELEQRVERLEGCLIQLAKTITTSNVGSRVEKRQKQTEAIHVPY